MHTALRSRTLSHEGICKDCSRTGIRRLDAGARAMNSGEATKGGNQGILRTYIFSTNHKIVGIQYFFLSLFAVAVGMLLSWIMRIHVAWGAAGVRGFETIFGTNAPGGVLTP